MFARFRISLEFKLISIAQITHFASQPTREQNAIKLVFFFLLKTIRTFGGERNNPGKSTLQISKKKFPHSSFFVMTFINDAL